MRDVLPYQDRILENVRSAPGVVGAALANRVPISLSDMNHTTFSMNHYQYERGEAEAQALRLIVGPEYFATVGTRLLQGREFQNTDTMDSEPVVIVDQNLVDRYYQGLNPVGMTINVWGTDRKIVGVAERVQDKPFFIGWEGYALYFPYRQWHSSAAYTLYVANVHGEERRQLRAIEQVILALDPKTTVETVIFEEVYAAATFVQRVPMKVIAFFSAIALFLSGLGLYGLISFIVAERTKEFGIRLALGAKPILVSSQIIRSSGKMVGVGLLAGLVFSFVIAIKINPVLKDVNATRPDVFVGVMIFVLLVCFGASLVPALRATRISINDTLRS